MNLLVKSFLVGVVLCCSASVGNAQQCPTGWQLFGGMCYYFSETTDRRSWTSAESFCMQNNGHLVSILTDAERNFVVNLHWVLGDRPEHYWIGLTDVDQENNWKWSDGSPYDSNLATWALQEPNNIGFESCVEVFIMGNPLNPDDGKWNDASCEQVQPFACKRETGDVSQCPSGWILQNSRCYQVVSDLTKEWFGADEECKFRGGDLVSVGSSTEEVIVENLLGTSGQQFYIGLSDTSSPSVFSWSDKVTSFTYNNWASGQPPNPLYYQGSTCVTIDRTLGNKWTTQKCSDEKPFICERGLRAQCPYSWIYADGKCYEFVVNTARVATWTEASRNCQAVGAGLIKIETPEQQSFVATALQGYHWSNQREIWMGISDIGHDESLQWWDKKPIITAYWDDNMPNTVQDRDDCGSLYTGRGGNNWEVSECFYQRGYICEIAEGKQLAQLPPVSVTGKCEDGWRHFKDKCYYFSGQELSQQSARTYCINNEGDLTSILDEAEESFFMGHLQGTSWIGLQLAGGGVSWTDGSLVTFQNWGVGELDNPGDCGMLDTRGYWRVSVCTEMAPFICKKDDIPVDSFTLAPPTNVPDMEKCGGNGWISDPQSPNCYKVYIQRRSWGDARYQCQVDGGDLASINTPNEQAFLGALGKTILSETKMWIGANDMHNLIGTDGGWRWSDGTPFNYLNWVSGEPNNQGDEDCAHMWLGDGKWNDNQCYDYQGFFCEKVGNYDNAFPGDVSDPNCRSNEACCFKHIGCEYRGIIPDAAFSASTEKDRWFNATRGRLNTPADVVIFSLEMEIFIGSGHGAWEPSGGDPDPWLQVDLPTHYEIKGIITQGRNGLLKHEEMQWTKTYKVSYSQDTARATHWQFISDASGETVIFDGNFDQNTMVTNFFPRPVIARHLRAHPMEYRDQRALRVEYIGCIASCLHKIGMNSGYIPDDKITASSQRSGREAKQGRAPVDPSQCLASSGDNGADYRGWISKTKNGRTCQPWNSQTPHPHSTTAQNYPEAGLIGDFCRNPDRKSVGPWCYTLDSEVQWEECDIPVCPNYTPAGWQPSGSGTNEWIQVQFDQPYRVGGITLYYSSSAGGYVREYTLSFSNDGFNFKQYVDVDNTAHRFIGLDGSLSEYMDILREPISATFIRIQPVLSQGTPTLSFEINGCYVDRVVSCSELGSTFLDKEDMFVVDCPPGCLEDSIVDPVFGTDIYTSHSSVCPSAIHAGKANDKLGGPVLVTMREGQLSYTGSYQHGITSESYGVYSSSFTFSGYSLNCEVGWYSWNDFCYWYSPRGDTRTWQSARASCLNMNADLVSILSQGENDFVESLLMKASNAADDAWIGFSDIETRNYYLWSDGSPVTFTKWWLNEPNDRDEPCVQMYIAEGYWNDKSCETPEPYVCKKAKSFQPPSTTSFPPTEMGCDLGWTAYESSCYRVSGDQLIQPYADINCQEIGGRLVSIGDKYEQAFVHALVTSLLPAFSGYTTWIGLTAHTQGEGGQYFAWRRSEEEVTYTNWQSGEPEALLKCTFPFRYRGVDYYECTTVDNPLAIGNQPWCSIDAQFAGRIIFCGNENPQGCTYMDDRTGSWNLELCFRIRYYVCEKNRIGFTQPVVTTQDPGRRQCATGWYGQDDTVSCYQINDKADRAERLSYTDALNHCRAQNADLVSIHSSEEETQIINHVYSNGVLSYTSFWLGLNNMNPDAGYQWTDGTPVSYTNWAGGEPNDHNGKEKCVESQMTNGATWNDLNCDAPRNWICKINRLRDPVDPPTLPPPQGEVSTECGTDVTWIKFTTPEGIDMCYNFETSEPHSWPYAERNCTLLGGHLVSMHSVEEKTFILSRIAKSGFEQHWIGLRDVASRQFQWSDESTLNYVNWAPGEPNNYLESEGCAEMTAHDGNWNDDNCGLRQSYICMKYMHGVPGTIAPTSQPEGECPSGYSRYGNKCYIIGNGGESDDRLSWYDAREACENITASLVVIENEYEQAYVDTLMYEVGRNAWIGMWGSAWNPYVWIDQSHVYYTNWDVGNPDYYSTSCVRINYASNSVGKWNDDDCNGRNAYMCYKRISTEYPKPEPTVKPENCPNGFQKYGDACFKVMSSAVSWDQARAACQNEGAGVNLASINQGYENSFLKSKFWRDISAENVWIGMTFTTNVTVPQMPIDSTAPPPNLVETTFTWSDGWPVEYTNWGIGEPNVDEASASSGCVYMKKDGGWNAVSTTGVGTSGMSCDSSMPFVCRKSLVPVPTPPMTPAPLEGNCDPGFVGFGAYCYYIEIGTLTVNTRTFGEAIIECQNRGAELASFHGETETIAIVNMITVTSHNLWIGLTHDGFSGWRWVDETPVDFFNWVPGEPNGVDRGELCVEMYPTDGRWNDVDCRQGRGYVCRQHKDMAYCGAVPVVAREECGYTGIDENVCLRRGCCWDPYMFNSSISGCFYASNDLPSREPGEPIPTSGLSGGAIAGIVIGILLLFGIAGVAFYFSRNGNPPSFLQFGSSTKSTPAPPKGFDNPITTLDTEQTSDA